MTKIGELKTGDQGRKHQELEKKNTSSEKMKNKKLCTIQGDGQEQLWSLLIHWRFREEMLFVPVYFFGPDFPSSGNI